MVKHTAHHDGVMRWIVVPQTVAGVISAPRHLWAREQTVEKTSIEILKDTLEIICSTLGRREVLASAHLAYKIRLSADGVAGNIATVMDGWFAPNWLVVHLGQQDMGNSSQYRFRRAFQEI